MATDCLLRADSYLRECEARVSFVELRPRNVWPMLGIDVTNPTRR